ncbi:protein of unknown function DUF45 [Coraliomargarita akajimensis DSM 45221]|uniref:YgjP-like metallopeptidase domain-containing protein n=2 Tax=Coraliomargarita TaxID=442430 RepID=D5EKG0_CORAD|nr:protein of unknown function DUF45 [Coraliomargarita akajimensis DSM 45221]
MRQDLCFELGGRSVSVELQRRKGTRHLRVRLGYQNQLLVSAPWCCSERAVLQFLEQQRSWVEGQLQLAPKARTLSDWLGEHPQMSASGDQFHVRIEATERARADYTFENGGADLVFRLPESGAEAHFMQVVRRFAKDALHCRVAYQAKRLELRVPPVSVRDQSSRWGSCSTTGSLSLNWRLILLEPELQDYVILHELAHLTEMNHSSRFWSLLSQYDPKRELHEAELDAIGPTIMRVGR